MDPIFVREGADLPCSPRTRGDGPLRLRPSELADVLAPMPVTRDVKETVRARIQRDPGFRETLLEEAIERLLAGELDLGKAVLRGLRVRGDRPAAAGGLRWDVYSGASQRLPIAAPRCATR